MQTLSFEDREEWLEARRGKITGSRLKDIIVKRGTGRKIGFYELVAERIGLPADDEDPMERGTRLEEEAVARFVAETGKKVDTSLVIWTRDDNQNIAVSPDGIIGKTAALEAKCLSSARHIEAFITQQIPEDYQMQIVQYFIVNDALKTLYMVFYDPRIPVKDFFYLSITRAQVQAEVDQYHQYQEETLKAVDEIVNQLTF